MRLGRFRSCAAARLGSGNATSGVSGDLALRIERCPVGPPFRTDQCFRCSTHVRRLPFFKIGGFCRLLDLLSEPPDFANARWRSPCRSPSRPDQAAPARMATRRQARSACRVRAHRTRSRCRRTGLAPTDGRAAVATACAVAVDTDSLPAGGLALHRQDGHLVVAATDPRTPPCIGRERRPSAPWGSRRASPGDSVSFASPCSAMSRSTL